MIIFTNEHNFYEFWSPNTIARTIMKINHGFTNNITKNHS